MSAIAGALRAEAARVGTLIAGFDDERWALPTRCPPMTVRDITVHMLRGALRIDAMIAAEPSDDEPEKDGVTYFSYDAAAEAPVVVKRAQEEAAKREGADLAAEWDRAWEHALSACERILAASDPVLPAIFGTMRLSEYLRTRVLEVCVHHMDLRDALGADPDPDPGALEATGDILRGLLGTDLRAAGMDDLRFALTGTGRASLDDDERTYLGPLADRFPLLS